MFRKANARKLVRTQLQVELGRIPTDEEVKNALGTDRNLSNRVAARPPTNSLPSTNRWLKTQTKLSATFSQRKLSTINPTGRWFPPMMNVALSFLDQREKSLSNEIWYRSKRLKEIG